MITDLDEVKVENAFAMIDASTLEQRTKADLKETIEEAKLNLNGRTLEERCASIARNQFDTTRFLADIIIQFKAVADGAKKQPPRTWKDVVAESKWPLAIVAGLAFVCSIFAPQIVGVLTALVRLAG